MRQCSPRNIGERLGVELDGGNVRHFKPMTIGEGLEEDDGLGRAGGRELSARRGRQRCQRRGGGF
jgi:hypothetical protein